MVTQAFEEMEVVNMPWLFCVPCCGSRSLKKASKILAIFGIALSLIFLVVGAGGNFVLVALHPDPSPYYYGSLESVVTIVAALAALVVGILLLTFNVVLLSAVKENKGSDVFRTIKLACTILLFMQLTVQILIVGTALILILMQKSPEDKGRYHLLLHTGLLIGAIVLAFLFFLLTIKALFAVHEAKPRLVTIYIYILIFITIFYLVFAGFLLVFWNQLARTIIKWFLTISWMSYLLQLLALHRNMMTRTLPTKHTLEV